MRRDLVGEAFPSSGTNAFQNTSRRNPPGISPATRAITVPPNEWPTSTTSSKSESTMWSTIERTQSSCEMSRSASFPWPAIVGAVTW